MRNNRNIIDEKIMTPAEYATQHVAQEYPFESAGWVWDVFKTSMQKLKSGHPCQLMRRSQE